MMNPVRVATGWLAGRLLVFLTILAALVALDAYREESTLLGLMLKGLVPDKELVQRLAQLVPEAHRTFLAGFEDLITIGDYAFVHAGVYSPRVHRQTWSRAVFFACMG